MSKRWKYTGLDPAQLVDGELFVDLVPGEEFDAPDSFVPEPYPHPCYQLVGPRQPSPQPDSKE